MKHLGDYDLSAVIYGKFSTYRPSTGSTYTLAGSPALSVYKDNSTTQSTSGVTLTADFDSVTGLNHFAIDTSSDGSFYSAGSFFDIVITTGTVDSVSVVGAVVASFTLRKNSALKPATAGRTLVVDSAGLADANTVKLGPTGSGTAQTARDIGANVLLSAGTGTGQLDFTSGIVKANVAQWLGSVPNALVGGNVPTTSGDPWDTSIPGAYAAGKAGYILGTNLDAVLSAVKAKTDPLTFTVSNQVDANTKSLNGTAQTAHDLGAGVLLSVGTGTGQVLLVSGRIAIQSNTQTNVALPDFPFVMVDTAGVPRTGLSVVGFRLIDGGALASCANSVTEISNGYYKIDLASSDLNGSVIGLRFVATGAQDRLITLIMLP